MRRRGRGERGRKKGPDFSCYHDDPVLFAREVLGITPWSRQADFLRAVADHDRAALKAGQKLSKSNALAILKLWFACTRPGARVFFTCAGERQVVTVNYRELKKLIRGAKLPLGIKHVHDTPGRGLIFENDSEIRGFATDEEDTWGGLSNDGPMLFIVDEASGVPSSLFEAIEGNTAGDNAKLVITGNPLRPGGYFFDAFNGRSASWHLMTISSLESPNVVEGRIVIPGLASAGYIARTRENYGEGSPFWQARVLGVFPSQSEYNVIGLGLVLDAVERGKTAKASGFDPLVCGLDCARFGDDASIACFVRGLVVVGLHVFRNCDGPTLAGRVVEAAAQYLEPGERLQVNVDVIGIGAAPYDALGAYAHVDAVAVNVAESPTVEDHYSRLRDQLWFECGKWLKTGAIPNDEKLVGELSAPLYSFDIKGNRKVEDKASLKQRLRRSPDRADALALAVYSTRPKIGAELYDQIDLDF